MIVMDNGEVATVASSDDEEMQPLEENSESGIDYDADWGDALITR